MSVAYRIALLALCYVIIWESNFGHWPTAVVASFTGLMIIIYESREKEALRKVDKARFMLEMEQKRGQGK